MNNLPGIKNEVPAIIMAILIDRKGFEKRVSVAYPPPMIYYVPVWEPAQRAMSFGELETKGWAPNIRSIRFLFNGRKANEDLVEYVEQ